MADIIRGDYDQLDQVAAKFASQADEIQQLLQRVRAGQDKLRDGWIGRGSDAFFAEMEQDVLPATSRLQTALSTANEATKSISQVLKSAEDEASGLFRQD